MSKIGISDFCYFWLPANLRQLEINMKDEKLNRRKLLGSTFALGAGIAMAGVARADETLKACGLTPAQTEGPFYPIQDQLDKNTDLTFVDGRGQKAVGEVVFLKGVVQDEFCRPVKGALVEIWQACHTGKYNHPSDPNPAKLDPNFQYWGQAITNEKGEYHFKTIIPGAYPATSTWMRPPHIHFKVNLRGFNELTSQLYFKGNKFNNGDRILRSLSREERERVIVDFVTKADGRKEGIFNISIKSI